MKLGAVHIALAAAIALSGCFDNREKPVDIPMVTNLVDLASADSIAAGGEIRIVLRGGGEPIPDGALGVSARVRTLDLSERGLAEIPQEVLAYPALNEFYFVRNKLAHVPAGLWGVPSLRYVNLDGNMIDEIGDEIGAATSLKWLRLNGNRLESLPKAVSQLGDLRRIYLQNNELKAVPPALMGLAKLEDIALDGNPGITSVPEWMLEMPSLRNVGLSGTAVTRLPDDLSGWSRLTSLNMADCPLSPEERRRIRAALPDVAMVF